MKKIITLLTVIIMTFPVIAQVPDYVSTNSLRGWWSFSSSARDASDDTIHGIVNGAVLTTDRINRADSAYLFNGTSNWINLGDNVLLNPGLSDVSISAWIKTSSSSGARIYSKGTSGGYQPGYDIMIYPGAGGRAALIFCPGGGGPTEKQLLSNSPVNDNNWHLITGVITRDSTMKLYVDGILQTTQVDISAYATDSIGTDTYNASIGASYTYYGSPNQLNEFFNGKIDEVGVWMRSLSQCEIKQLYYERASINTIKVGVCDSYTSPSGRYNWTSSGTYFDTIPNFYGCDSIITIDLTVEYSTSSSITENACYSYTAPDGAIYTASGIITAIIPNAAGCDSTITIDLTINDSTTSSITETACDSYTAPDETVYTTSGIKKAIIPNVAGCDSIITIDLTIMESTTSSIAVTACNRYTAPDGTVYTTSGIKTAIIPNAAGCDSIITIDLTINNVNVTVLQTANVLTANATPATYQWLDCDNNFNLITDEVGQALTAAADGNYAVEVTQNECVDTSTCYSVSVINIIENTFGENIIVYPNPTSGLVFIDFGTSLHEAKVILSDFKGIIIKEQYYTDTQLLTINTGEADGIYFITIVSENRKAIIRIVNN